MSNRELNLTDASCDIQNGYGEIEDDQDESIGGPSNV